VNPEFFITREFLLNEFTLIVYLESAPVFGQIITTQDPSSCLAWADHRFARSWATFSVAKTAHNTVPFTFPADVLGIALGWLGEVF